MMSERKKFKIPEFEGNFPVVEDESMMEVYRALNRIGEAMKGEAERAGLDTEEKIVQYIKQLRKVRRERRQNESAI